MIDKKLGMRLREIRKSKGFSLKDVADGIGSSKGTIGNIERGDRPVSLAMVKTLAEFLGVSMDYLVAGSNELITNNENNVGNKEDLLEEDRNENIKNDILLLGKVKEIPIYSLQPKNRDEIFAQENIIGREPVPADTLATIAVKMNDDSMSGSRINEGDRVIIQEQNTFNDGQTVFVQLPDRSLVIRKATHTNDDGIILSPENSVYQPQHFKQNELNIFGIVVQVNFDYI